MATTNDNITSNSLALFLALAGDAGNWEGHPMTELTKETRGNLTQLKRAGLLVTWTDEDYRGCVFVRFTDSGKALAREHGIDL